MRCCRALFARFGSSLLTHSASLDLAIKFCFVRLLRGTVHLQESTKTHWIAWISIVTGVVSLAFIIAQVIPFFDQVRAVLSLPVDQVLTRAVG